MDKVLMKGNEAIAEAAIQAGCRYFFGYPITPQNEIPAYMAKRLPEENGVFLQAESEISAINMVYGAAGAGARVMTSSSSPGISLKQEGISYIVGAELPCVIVNIVRGGPGLGGIQPAQSDYLQATKSAGHGDSHMVVFAPSTIQEAVDLTMYAFDVADRYRNPVMILGDGMLGQMMEPVSFRQDFEKVETEKNWATTGWDGVSRDRNIINSLHILPEALEAVVHKIYSKYEVIEQEEVRYETYNCQEASIIITAFGTTARIVRNVIERLEKEEHILAGMIRPISLWPFPKDIYREIASKDQVLAFLDVEMNMGQMIEDVKQSIEGAKPIYFTGRTGGMIPSEDQIIEKVKSILREVSDYDNCLRKA